MIRGLDALAGGEVLDVTGFPGVACGQWAAPTADLEEGALGPGVLLLCEDPEASMAEDSLIHRIDGLALLEGRPEVQATLSGFYGPPDRERSGLGDLDGDSLRELGLRSAEGSGTLLGFVVPGSAWQRDAEMHDVAWRLEGEYGSVGLAPQVIDDTDGDGAAELLLVVVPSSYVDERSVGTRLMVIGGSALRGTLPGATLDLLTLPEVVVVEGPRSMGVARQVGGAGDVDGDGLEDIAVSFGPHDEPGPDQAGDLRIVLSSTLGEVALDDCPSLTGVLVGELLDTRLWPLGDLDGDGFPEWVSADGIWAGTSLLEVDPAPIAPGLDAIACLGDLDLDGAEELGIAGSRY